MGRRACRSRGRRRARAEARRAPPTVRPTPAPPLQCGPGGRRRTVRGGAPAPPREDAHRTPTPDDWRDGLDPDQRQVDREAGVRRAVPVPGQGLHRRGAPGARQHLLQWSRHLEEDNTYVLVEAFQDDAGDAHVQSDHFQKFVAQAPDWVSQKPKIINVQNVPQDGWARWARSSPADRPRCPLNRGAGRPGQTPTGSRSADGRRHPRRPTQLARPRIAVSARTAAPSAAAPCDADDERLQGRGDERVAGPGLQRPGVGERAAEGLLPRPGGEDGRGEAAEHRGAQRPAELVARLGDRRGGTGPVGRGGGEDQVVRSAPPRARRPPRAARTRPRPRPDRRGRRRAARPVAADPSPRPTSAGRVSRRARRVATSAPVTPATEPGSIHSAASSGAYPSTRLQVLRQQQEQADQREHAEQVRRHRHRERRAREQPEVQQRVREAALAADEQRARRDAHAGESAAPTVGPSVATVLSAETSGNTATSDSAAEARSKRPGCGSRRLGQEERPDDQQQHDHGHVDQEDRAPPEVLEQHARRPAGPMPRRRRTRRTRRRRRWPGGAARGTSS